MRNSWATLALAAVMATMVLAGASSAVAQRSPDTVRIDVNLKDADMIAATQAITHKTGLQFVIEPSTEPFNRVTLSINGVTPEDAIKYICNASGAYFRRDDSGVYIISRNKPIDATVVPPTDPKIAPGKVVTYTKKIYCLHTDPKSVYDTMMYQIPMTAGSGWETLQKFKSAMSPQYSQIFGNNAPTILQTASPTDLSRGSAPLTGRETGNGISLPGEAAMQGASAGQAPGSGGLGQGGGGGNAQLTGGQGLVPQSIDYISYDPTDNSIVVRGTSEDDIAELQRYISLFDTPPQQVEIKVEFVTTTEDLTKSIGYDFLYQRGALFTGNRPGSFARSGDPVFLNYATGNITTRLRTQLSEGRGKVVSAPTVRTLNNQPASVTNSITTYIFINQITISNGTVVTTTNPIALQAFSQLAVAPRINADGTVTVYLSPQISSFVGFSTGPNGEQIPNQVSQALNLVARVRDGETIVLGGLTTKNENYNVGRIPILGDLPIIGQFFRSNVRTKANSELLIFVTPRVIPEDEGGG